MSDQARLAGPSHELNTPIGPVFIGPTGLATLMTRGSAVSGGKFTSISDLSDHEIAVCGLTGRVLPACAEANRLNGPKVKTS
jgi:hypothetical protein